MERGGQASVLLFLIVLSTASAACPGTISTSYSLTYDATSSGATCITITGSNLVLDCQGHTITNLGASGSGVYGIYISGARSNVTIKNCALISNYYNGVYVSTANSNNLNFYNNTVYNSSYNGFDIEVRGANNTLENNTAYKISSHGFDIRHNINATLRNNAGYNNSGNGVLFYNTNSSTLTNNTMYRNGYDGILLMSTSTNNILTNNTVHTNGDQGFHLDSSSSNTFVSNRAYNNSDHGFYLYLGSSNVFTNNSAYSNTIIGFNMDSVNRNTFSGNLAYLNSQYGFIVYRSSNTTFTGNSAYNNTYHGFGIWVNNTNITLANNSLYSNAMNGVSLGANSRMCTLTGNSAYNNSINGFYLYSDAANNVVANNTAFNNTYYGFVLTSGSSGNNLTNNTAYGHTYHGFFVSNASNNTLANNTAFNNTRYGIILNTSSLNNTLSGNVMYNNGYAFYAAASSAYTMSNSYFLNPSGGYENYTVLSAADSLGASEVYTINWTANENTPPDGVASFRQKFVNISTVSGSPSITRVSMQWSDSELSGYNESRFNLFRYGSSGWAILNNSPDTSANTLTAYAFSPGSDYGILQSDNTPLSVSLSSPSAGMQSFNQQVSFNCSAVSGFGLQNITLYGNWSGSWAANETQTLTGTSNSTAFTKTIPVGNYTWNCLASDPYYSSFATSNRAFSILSPAGGTFIYSGASLISNYSFSGGAFTSALFNLTAQAVMLNASSSGAYLSQVFNMGADVAWKNATWLSNIGNLPDNGISDNSFNMSGNQLLLHCTNTGTTTVEDTSGNNRDGTMAGNTYYTAGKFGDGVYMDGSGDYVTFGDLSALEGNSKVTYSLWVNVDGSQGTATTFFSKGSGGTSTVPLVMATCNTNKFGFIVESADGSLDAFTTDGTYTTGVWHHIVYVVDNSYTGNGVAVAYIDGVKQTGTGVSSGCISTALHQWGSGDVQGTSTSDALIGARDEDPYTQYFKGTVDEVSVWNRALTQAEALSLYERGMVSINLSAHGCDDSACSGEENIWERNCTSTPCDFLDQVSPSPYMQYRLAMGAYNTSFSPRAYNVLLYYDNEAPAVTLNSPVDNSIATNSTITFNCSATDDLGLHNVTLYGNWSGSWAAEETKPLTGLSNSTTFTKTIPDGNYKWNCMADDGSFQAFAPANRTFRLYTGAVDLDDQSTWIGIASIGNSTFIINSDVVLRTKDYSVNTLFPFFVFNGSYTLDCNGSTITNTGVGTAVLSNHSNTRLVNCTFEGFSRTLNFLDINQNSHSSSLLFHNDLEERSIRDVAIDNEGYYVFVGNMYDGSSSYKWYVRKMRPDGTLVWNYTLGSGNYGGTATSIKIDADGNYIIAGEYGVLNAHAAYMEKLYKNGTRAWSWTGDTYSVINSVAIDADGNYVLAGYNAIGNRVWRLIKLSPARTTVWSKTLNLSTSLSDVASEAIVDQEGNYLFSGGNGTTAFLFKYSPSGTYLWNWSLAQSGALAVAADREGNYGVVLTSRYGMPDPYMMVYSISPSGSTRWSWVNSEYTYGGLGGGSIAIDQEGQYIAGGEIFVSDSYNNGAYVVKLTPGGSHIWNETFDPSGGSGYMEHVSGIQADESGNIVLAVQGGTSNDEWYIYRINTTRNPLAGITLEEIQAYDNGSAGFLFAPNAAPTFTNLVLGYNSSVGKIRFSSVSGPQSLSTKSLILDPTFVSLNATESPEFNVSSDITLYAGGCENVRYYKANGFPSTYAQITSTGARFTPSESSCADGITVFSTYNGFSGYATNNTPDTCVIINESGAYTLANNLVGADNPVSGFSGISIACIIVSASNVDFSCAGYNITNNGTANAAAILINGTAGAIRSNVTIRDCPVITAYKRGLHGNLFSGSAIRNSTINGSTEYGMHLSSANTTLSALHFFGSTTADAYLSFGASSSTISAQGIIFDSSGGAFQNYTNLSFHDSGTSNNYTIKWSSIPATPANLSSFLGKYIDISTVSGTVSINQVNWTWADSELTGYNESRFEIWKYSGSNWSNASATLYAAENILSITNLNPASGYGPLENNNITEITNLTVTLDSPGNGTTLTSSTVNLQCSAQTTETLQNITLYGDWGGWHANETASLSGTSDSHTFSKTLPDGTYTWNCLAFDDANSTFAEANFTFTINTTFANTTITLHGANATIINTSKYQSNITSGNYTTEGGNITGVNISTNASTEKWAGFYGNTSADIRLSENNTALYMYLWAWNSSNGGVVCLSTNGLLSTFPAAGASGSDIDSAWGFTPADADSGANTYNGTGCSLQFGTETVSNASFVDTGNAGGFQTCALKTVVSPAKSEMLFCVNITYNGPIYNGQAGDFEMMVPTPQAAGAFETYYFYLSLN